MLRRLRWDLDRFDGYVGINNHMGSRFTGDAAGMEPVMEELKARGLMFLDSRTTGNSTGIEAGAPAGRALAARDVFLDNEHRRAARSRSSLPRSRAGGAPPWQRRRHRPSP